MRTGDLFSSATPPRRKPRVLMHFTDAGYVDGLGGAATFECRRCGHETDWLAATDTEIRRGIPCPVCNACTNPVTAGIDRTSSGAIGMP